MRPRQHPFTIGTWASAEDDPADVDELRDEIARLNYGDGLHWYAGMLTTDLACCYCADDECGREVHSVLTTAQRLLRSRARQRRWRAYRRARRMLAPVLKEKLKR